LGDVSGNRLKADYLTVIDDDPDLLSNPDVIELIRTSFFYSPQYIKPSVVCQEDFGHKIWDAITIGANNILNLLDHIPGQ
jgi:hypothetical protein